MSSTKNTARKSSSKELPTVYWIPPLSSETSEPLTEKVMPKDTEDVSIYLLEDFLANLSPSQETEKPKTMPETCGLKQSAQYGWYDPESATLKTCQASLLADTSQESLQTFTKAGMITSDGRLWELMMSEQGIGVKGSGYWLSPRASDFKGAVSPHSAQGAIDRMGQPTNLPEHVVATEHNLWPTPNTINRTGRKMLHGECKGRPYRTSLGLEQVAEIKEGILPKEMDCIEDAPAFEHMWPSPQAMDSVHRSYESFEGIMSRHRQGRSMPPKLADIGHWENWPTPATRDYKGAVKPETLEAKGRGATNSLGDAIGEGASKGTLNPNWTEWLMGWPISWSNLKPIAELLWLDWSVDPADNSAAGMMPTPSACTRGAHIGREMDGNSTKAIGSGVKWGMTIETFAKHNCGDGLIPRLTTIKENRVSRLKAIGNGQVPQTMARAWELLTGS